MWDRETPTADANSAWVTSSITRVSRHNRAKTMRKGVDTVRVKQPPLIRHLLGRL